MCRFAKPRPRPKGVRGFNSLILCHEKVKIMCFGYESRAGFEAMRKRDAEIAIGMQISQENPELTDEQAMKIGEEFIRDARSVEVLVEKDGRKGAYQGDDPYRRRSLCCMGCF
jgi:hypothetical protein